MVNKRFWLAAALVLGIVFAGCKQDVNYELPEAKGKMTINGIPEKHNGKYVFFSGPSPNPTEAETSKVVVCGFTEIRDLGKGENESIKLATISEGKAEIPLYIINRMAESFSDYIQAYSGNDVFRGNIFIIIVDDDETDDGFLTWTQVGRLKNPATRMDIIGETSDGNFTTNWPEGNMPPDEDEIEEEEDD
jgi:hypothetical protein